MQHEIVAATKRVKVLLPLAAGRHSGVAEIGENLCNSYGIMASLSVDYKKGNNWKIAKAISMIILFKDLIMSCLSHN